MPVLTFKGKTAVENYHHTLPHHVLDLDVGRSVLVKGDKPSLDANLIIEGDNLLALKALLPTHAGRIKCVYIDPPYNTGNEGWAYNDNLTQPQFKEWIGQVVGKEGEDATRHDKWCCMMYPRLQLLQELLRDDGSIFVSIDDNEIHHLRMLMDEVFGPENLVGTIVWRNVTDNNPTNISVEHEYLVCYAKKRESLPAVWSATALPIKQRLTALADDFKKKFPNVEERQREYSKWFQDNKAYLWPFDRYRYIDDGGIYTGSQSVHNPGKEGYRYDVLHPKTRKPCQQPLMGYRFPRETMNELLASNRILFGEDESKIIEIKLYIQEFKAKLSSVIELDTRLGANELRLIFSEQTRPFPFPKPTAFLKEFLAFVTAADDIVLDSFAGSGTTAHAVLDLNKEDNGSRRFILVQRQHDSRGDEKSKLNMCDNLTAERVRRVIGGYTPTKRNGQGKKKEKVEGLGGSFTYARLGAPLLGEHKTWGEKPPAFGDLAKYIFFTETSQQLDLKQVNEATGRLCEHAGTAYYLLYTPDPKESRALDRKAMEALANDKARRKVVYSEKLWLHRDELTAAREQGNDVRPMLLPFQVK